MARTVQDIINTLQSPAVPELEAPRYLRPPTWNNRRVFMAVASMKDHMSNEGYELARALDSQNYWLAGKGFVYPETNTVKILHDLSPCSTLVLQDKREWDPSISTFRDPTEAFENVKLLKECDHIFKLTVLKDSHQRPHYHRDSAAEIGCHAWIIYYHPDVVKHLAPYVRREHLIRTYHSVDPAKVPPFDQYGRLDYALLSGAVSGAYPLRSRLVSNFHKLEGVHLLKHPGYHRNGTNTNEFLTMLSRYKVSICTTSMYGYSLRKIVESVACGCKVITDLPLDDRLPLIDNSLLRIDPDIFLDEFNELVKVCIDLYDPNEQYEFARRALAYYSFTESGKRLAEDIETLRFNYPNGA